MRAGSVIVDIAAEQGGNCELTQGRRNRRPQRREDHRPGQPAGSLAYNASEMYARNLLNFLKPAIDKAGELKIDWTDEVFAGAVLTHDGAIKHEATRKAVEG